MSDAGAVKQSVAGVFDRAASSYDQTGVDFFETVGRELVDRADPRPGEWVLDLGCGLGATVLPAAERVGPRGRVLGVDLAPRMVAGLLAKARTSGLANVEAVVGDAESPAVEAGRWDLVQSGLALFFLPECGAAVRAYRGLLRPGGRLAFSWFGRDDSRWDPIFASLVAELPAEQLGPRRPGEEGPFSGVEAMHAFLSDSGYDDVRTELREVTVVYADEETWWRTMWSHGRRATMERLQQAGVLESTMRRMSADFDRVRRPDGSLEWSPEMAYTLART